MFPKSSFLFEYACGLDTVRLTFFLSLSLKSILSAKFGLIILSKFPYGGLVRIRSTEFFLTYFFIFSASSQINFGFSDCVRKFHPDFIQTYRHYRNRENYPWELDHMFATKKLYDSLQKVEVHFNNAIEKVSDHNPIVAEFNL